MVDISENQRFDGSGGDTLEENHFTFKNADDFEIHVYRWSGRSTRKGVIQISHGMVENAIRYKRFAQKLVDEGFCVYANDHRGHGETAGSPEKVGHCGHDGFTGMVQDMHQLTDYIRKVEEGLPIFLFGHSMGSFLTQQYLCDYPNERLAGVILSGANGKDPSFLLWILSTIAKREINRHGEEWRSNRLTNIIFGNYNKPFLPARTKFDWLSRDPVEVDEYIRSPYCGSVCSSGFYADLFRARREQFHPEKLQRMRTDIPIYVFSGDKDPVGRKGKGVHQLVGLYRKYGLKQVELRLYPNGRHEMLNDTNRDEVMQHVIDWLNRQLKMVTNGQF